jgi:phenylacetate-CoA ligase
VNKFLNYLYAYSPAWLQNIGVSLFGYVWYKNRFGGVFKEEVKVFKSREEWSYSQFDSYKLEQFRKIVIYALENVAYYRQLYADHSINKEQVENMSLDEVSRIPFLEKNALRLYGESTLMADGYTKNGTFHSSSGSTGTPTKIYFSKVTHQRWSAAFEVRIRHWAGIDYKTPRGMIGGRRVLPNASDGPPYYRFNMVEKQVYYSAYHIAPNTVYNYIEGMRKHGVQYMNGYAVSNYLLASFIKNQGLKAPKLEAVITSSEKLTPQMRAVFEEVYQCKSYDSWSGVEACALVSECEHGSLHISEDVGILEILDENGNEVGEGETGEVVCTGFLNYDQPLIRYRIGDRMTKGKGQCKCGRQMPIIEEIEGRLEDVVTGPDGRQMVRFHSIFVGIPTIERTQVIQHSIDHLEIKIQNEVSLTEEEVKLIDTRVRSQLGQIKLVINQHQQIEQSKSGKYKAVISHLKT